MRDSTHYDKKSCIQSKKHVFELKVYVIKVTFVQIIPIVIYFYYKWFYKVKKCEAVLVRVPTNAIMYITHNC